MNLNRIFRLILASALCFAAALGATACDGDGADAKTVSSITVDKLPDKTEYYVGDTFDPTGGEITVVYTDGTSEVIALTASGVTLGEVNTAKPGDKTVTVNYGGKRATFKVSVQTRGYVVTFNHNYDGAPTPDTQNVIIGGEVQEPSEPTRGGFSFYAWYTDQNCTIPYNFADRVYADATLYAAWKDNAKTYREFKYELNYYGVKPQSFTQIVETGGTAKPLAAAPTRSEYVFDGWYTDEAGTHAYIQNAAVGADTIVYAKWTKTKAGPSTYVFEAENTDLTGKVGPGFSGTAQEESMIVVSASLGASGGKFVSYLYSNGNSLEFHLACGEPTDITLAVSMAAEMDNISFNSDEYQVIVNGIPQSFDTVVLQSGANFSDAVVVQNLSLTKGYNLIRLVTNNTRRPMGEGGTYGATAPMIDCIKLTTSAVIAWDANYGLPKNY
ncbi:MAG: InlB B-repeat-containing protein [Clostridiales bacterium]|nr:InlB B-repeat-containing protein [Clostridiales bacterium]